MSPSPSQPTEPNTAVTGPPRTVAAGVPEKASEDPSQAEASQEPEAGQPNAIEQSVHAAPARPEPEREGAPWAVLSAPIAPAGAAEIANSGNSATINATASADVATTAPADSEPVKLNSRLPEFVASASAETEHRVEQPLRGVAGRADPQEADRTRPPEAVSPPAIEMAAAAPTPRRVEDAPEHPRLKRAEPDAILARGDALFATGDLASARLFYEEAASTGDGAAALRLGATFDPDFLARAHADRGQGDLAIASYWYRRARDLGNSDAEILLRRMENIVK